MRTARVLIILILLMVGAQSKSWAQAKQWWSMEHYGSHESQESSFLLADFNYQLESNRLTNQLLNQATFDGVIQSTATQFLLTEEQSNSASLAGGIQGNMTYFLHRDEGLNFIFSASMSDVVYSSSAVGLYQLFMLGNGPFEDQTIGLGKSKFSYLSSQGLGFGIDKKSDKSRFGIRLDVQKISRFQELTIEDGSELYTAPFGEELNFTVDAALLSSQTSQSKAGAWMGTSFSLNGYWQHQSEEGTALISLEVNNLGLIHFGGYEKVTVDFDSTFTGFEVQEILSGDISFEGSSSIDSLEAFFGVTTENQSGIRPTLPQVKLRFVKRMSEKMSLMVSAGYMVSAPLPEARIGLCFKPTKALGVEPYCNIGGFSRANAGLGLSLIPSHKFQLTIQYGLIGSQLLPEKSTSQHLNGILGLSF